MINKIITFLKTWPYYDPVQRVYNQSEMSENFLEMFLNNKQLQQLIRTLINTNRSHHGERASSETPLFNGGCASVHLGYTISLPLFMSEFSSSNCSCWLSSSGRGRVSYVHRSFSQAALNENVGERGREEEVLHHEEMGSWTHWERWTSLLPLHFNLTHSLA